MHSPLAHALAASSLLVGGCATARVAVGMTTSTAGHTSVNVGGAFGFGYGDGGGLGVAGSVGYGSQGAVATKAAFYDHGVYASPRRGRLGRVSARMGQTWRLGKDAPETATERTSLLGLGGAVLFIVDRDEPPQSHCTWLTRRNWTAFAVEGWVDLHDDTVMGRAAVTLALVLEHDASLLGSDCRR
jgi:hypothetical protein